MIRPTLPLLRPVAQGLAITSWIALAGCGASTSATPPATVEPVAVMPSAAPQREQLRAEGTLVKRAAPAPMMLSDFANYLRDHLDQSSSAPWVS